MKRPFAVIGITYLTAQAVAVLFGSTAAMAILFACLPAAVICFLISKKSRILFSVLLTAALACAAFLTFRFFFVAPSETLGGRSAFISGTVSRDPQSSEGRYYYTIRTESISLDDAPQKISLRLSSDVSLEAQYGDKIYAEVSFSTPNAKRLYSDRVRLYASGVTAACSAVNPDDCIITSGSGGILSPAISIKHAIIRNIDELYTDESGAMLKAMITSGNEYLSDAALHDLRDAGISHIISVSGLHMTLISAAVIWFLRKLHLHRKIVAVITAVVLWSYIAIAGFPLSAMRSGLMLSLLLLGRLLDRLPDSLNSLGFSVFVICLINPYSAADTGLLMSFLATLGLILCYPVMSGYIRRHVLPEKKGFLPGLVRKSADAAAIAAVAAVFTAPVTALVYRRIPLFSIIVNALLSYVFTLFLLIGLISVLLSFLGKVGMVCAYPFMAADWLLDKVIRAVAHAASSLPGSVLYAGDRAFLAVVAVSFLIGLWYVLYGRKKQRLKHSVLLTLMLCTAVVFCAYTCDRIFSHRRNITVISSGDGACVLVRDNSDTVMIGAGGSEYDIWKAYYEALDSSIDRVGALVIPEDTDEFSSGLDKTTSLFMPESILFGSTDREADAMPEGALCAFGGESTVTAGKITVTMRPDGNGILWTSAECDTMKALICPTGADCLDSPFISGEYDLLVCPCDIPANASAVNCRSAVICTGSNGALLSTQAKIRGIENVFSTDEDGTLLFYRSDGNLYMEALNR